MMCFFIFLFLFFSFFFFFFQLRSTEQRSLFSFEKCIFLICLMKILSVMALTVRHGEDWIGLNGTQCRGALVSETTHYSVWQPFWKSCRTSFERFQTVE